MTTSGDLHNWRANWHDAGRARWREIHKIVAREEPTNPKRAGQAVKKSRRIEALKLIAASLIYDLDSVRNLPDDRLTLPYKSWLDLHPTLAHDLPVDEIPLFDGSRTVKVTTYMASMHIPSAAIRLSSALCLVASELLTKSRFHSWCQQPKSDENRDWERSLLLRHLRSASKAASGTHPTRTGILAEDAAMLVAHRDQFGHGREYGRSGGGWRRERGDLYGAFCARIMLDAHLELIRLAVEELQ